MKVTLIGAGSRSFGPATVRDLLLSRDLRDVELDVVLMDAAIDRLSDVEAYARSLAGKLSPKAKITSTNDLQVAVENAQFVVTAIEVDRWRHWEQDFHVPRKYGFRQVYGENGGPGGLFHALRNIGPMLAVAEMMAGVAPGAVLLNYTNPEHKLCEAISRLTEVHVVGLCHGFFIGARQLEHLLDLPVEHLELKACGINHMTWFQTIVDRRTKEDLYPRLRELDAELDPLSDWHEIGLSRVLFRRFGLWPSPGANHIGEYIRWADEFVASELQFYSDPWPSEGVAPRSGEFVYTIDQARTERVSASDSAPLERLEDAPLEPSGELAVPIIEALGLGVARELAAVNVPNKGAIPGLPDDMVVEVPAVADARGLQSVQMQPLPTAIEALVRLQGSIHRLLVEAYAEQSKDKLLQAVLLDPTVDSYRRAVAMVNEMVDLQRDLLPPLR